jgi:hypothetical protein
MPGSLLPHEVSISLSGRNYQVTYVSLLGLCPEGPLFASRPWRSVQVLHWAGKKENHKSVDRLVTPTAAALARAALVQRQG